LLCRRYARADSGRAMHAAAARERKARCASAPETELFSPSYFLLHGTIQLSTYSVTGWLLSVFTVRVPRAALTVRGTPIPSQRESESVTGWAARVRVRHGLGCSAATVFTVRVPRAGQLSVYSRSEGLRVRGRVRHGDSRARLLSRRRCLPTTTTTTLLYSDSGLVN
jgi:hypothetical protein